MTRPSADPLMAAVEYDRMREAEDVHWWYGALRSQVAAELRRLDRRAGAGRVLDAGCGTGGSLVRWAEAVGAPCYGIDLAPEALAHSRRRGERLLAYASTEALPFPDRVFDAVVSLDVICLDGVDQARALAEMRRVLRPGGTLILNLPAFEALRGEHDRAVRIGRRYTRREVVALLRASGFGEVRASYWNSFLFPAAWLIRRLRRGGAGARSDLFALPRPLNAALGAVVRAERAVLGRVPRPFGTSVLAVTERR